MGAGRLALWTGQVVATAPVRAAATSTVVATGPVRVAAVWAVIALAAEMFREAPLRGTAVPLGMAGPGGAAPPALVAREVLRVWGAVEGAAVCEAAVVVCEAAVAEAVAAEGSDQTFLFV